MWNNAHDATSAHDLLPNGRPIAHSVYNHIATTAAGVYRTERGSPGSIRNGTFVSVTERTIEVSGILYFGHTSPMKGDAA